MAQLEPARVAVKNAADPKQVRSAGRQEARRQDRYHAAVRALLSLPEGRLVLHHIVLDAGVRTSVFDHSGSVTYFNAGRQNFGLELEATFESIDDDKWALAQQEARTAARRDATESEAVRTARATGDDE